MTLVTLTWDEIVQRLIDNCYARRWRRPDGVTGVSVNHDRCSLGITENGLIIFSRTEDDRTALETLFADVANIVVDEVLSGPAIAYGVEEDEEP